MSKMNPNHFRQRRRVVAVTAAALGMAVLSTSCASPEQEGSASANASDAVDLDPELFEAAVSKAESLAGGLGGSLAIIHGSSGHEGAIVQATYAAFTEGTGVEVKYSGTKDVLSILQSRVQAGNPPDVAEVGLGVASDYAAAGDLVFLDDVVSEDELANYSTGLLESGSHEGNLFAVFPAVNNYMVWYNPQQYSGPIAPESWDDMVAWTDELAEAGSPAWCIPEEAGAGTGFPGSQLLENLFLKKYGPELYKEWGEGELAWTSPEVSDAWEMFGEIAANDSTVYGGVTGSLADPFVTGLHGLIGDPATCEAVLWGAWVPSFVGEGLEPGANLDFFRIPPSNPQFEGFEAFIANPIIAFNDTPQVRAFMQYLASTEAAALLASADHWTVGNTAVPADSYGSPLLRKASETFFAGDVELAAGPMVLAGSDVLAAFYKGIVSYLQNPDSLDSVLATIQKVQDQS